MARTLGNAGPVLKDDYQGKARKRKAADRALDSILGPLTSLGARILVGPKQNGDTVRFGSAPVKTTPRHNLDERSTKAILDRHSARRAQEQLERDRKKQQALRRYMRG